MKKLIPLRDHNMLQWKRHQCMVQSTDIPNGIACPLCSSELFDTDINVVKLTNPPQYDVHCLRCHFKGTRY